MSEEISGDSRQKEFEYAKRDHEFTSERYKIEVNNLPRTMPYQAVQGLLTKTLGLKVHKIKLASHKVYVTFHNETDRDIALKALNGYVHKNAMLEASVTRPVADPVINKRRKMDGNTRSNNEYYTDNIYQDETEYKNDEELTDDDINYKISPLWDKDYEQQLQLKRQSVEGILIYISKQIGNYLSPNLKRDYFPLFKWWSTVSKQNSRMCCPFEGVVESPVVENYRNKCEFSIGLDSMIGFRCGNYKNGSIRVMKPPKNNRLLNKSMFKIIDLCEEFLRSRKLESELKPFDLTTHKGNIRQITVRTNSNNDVLIILDMSPMEKEEETEKEIEKFVNHLTTIRDEDEQNIKSIFVNVSKNLHMITNEHLRLVYGQDHIIEKLSLGDNEELNFTVGPLSFFQINTPAANLLYNKITTMANLNKNSLVLDIGCGTGTISLSLASKVAHVIGIDISKSSIEDAKLNAKINQIKNASFYHGRAEDLIDECLTILHAHRNDQKPEERGEIFTILDPPRRGLNASVIKALRSSAIRRIIYVACDARNNRNLIDLCRPPSKAYIREPFVPTSAVAIDLFPHTLMVEVVFMYERLDTTVYAPNDIQIDNSDRTKVKKESEDEESEKKESSTNQEQNQD